VGLPTAIVADTTPGTAASSSRSAAKYALRDSAVAYFARGN